MINFASIVYTYLILFLLTVESFPSFFPFVFVFGVPSKSALVWINTTLTTAGISELSIHNAVGQVLKPSPSEGEGKQPWQ